MRSFAKLRLRLRTLFRRRALDAQLAVELAFHVEQHAAELRAAGVPVAEARRRALAAFGGVAQVAEACRDRRRLGWLDDLARDAAYALRGLRRAPAFTAVAVATLALAIGANTAIFSLVEGFLLRSLPVPHPEQLVALGWSAQAYPRLHGVASWGDCLDISAAASAHPAGCTFSYPFFRQIAAAGIFSHAFAAQGIGPENVFADGRAAIAFGRLVSGDYFATLGLRPALGRFFSFADDRPGAPPVVVLGYGYWRARFGADPRVLGRAVEINRVPATVIGVAPANFPGTSPGEPEDFWIPLAAGARLSPGGFNIASGRAVWWLVIVGRLAPGVSRTQAQAVAATVFQRDATAGPKPALAAAPQLALLPAGRGLASVRSEYAQTLLLLFALVGLILLIAAANLAGLLLARGEARRREMAVRGALGAGRARLVRQMLTESLLLAALGGALGLLFAAWGAHALGAFLGANSWGGVDKLGFTLDGRVLAFACALTIATAIVFGLPPALRAGGARLAPALKLGGAAGGAAAGRRRFTLGNALVAAQVALAVLLLAGAGLLARTLANLEHVGAGFDTRNLLAFAIDPSAAGYDAATAARLYPRLAVRLRAVPGVVSVGYANMRLLSGGGETSDFRGAGASPPREAHVLMAGPDYLATLRLPILAGRAFAPADFAPHAPPVAVVNRAFARRFFGAADPVGRRIEDGDANSWHRIIGLVPDFKYENLRAADPPTIFLPSAAQMVFGADFLLRTAADPRAAIPAVRAAVAAVDPALPVAQLTTEAQTIATSLYRERLLATLAGLFAALGLALAAIGLYGLLAFEVARRTREIGVRVALGARCGDVIRHVAFHGLALAAAGLAAGIAAGLAATRVLASLLYGVATSDPLTYAAVAGLLLAVALVAALLPARRAARIDPMAALRCE